MLDNLRKETERYAQTALSKHDILDHGWVSKSCVVQIQWVSIVQITSLATNVLYSRQYIVLIHLAELSALQNF